METIRFKVSDTNLLVEYYLVNRYFLAVLQFLNVKLRNFHGFPALIFSTPYQESEHSVSHPNTDFRHEGVLFRFPFLPTPLPLIVSAAGFWC